jgi:hypothetical protein
LRWNPATITADKCCRQSIAAVAFYLTVTSPRQSTASVMLRYRLLQAITQTASFTGDSNKVAQVAGNNNKTRIG